MKDPSAVGFHLPNVSVIIMKVGLTYFLEKSCDQVGKVKTLLQTLAFNIGNKIKTISSACLMWDARNFKVNAEH